MIPTPASEWLQFYAREGDDVLHILRDAFSQSSMLLTNQIETDAALSQEVLDVYRAFCHLTRVLPSTDTDVATVQLMDQEKILALFPFDRHKLLLQFRLFIAFLAKFDPKLQVHGLVFSALSSYAGQLVLWAQSVHTTYCGLDSPAYARSFEFALEYTVEYLVESTGCITDHTNEIIPLTEDTSARLSN